MLSDFRLPGTRRLGRDSMVEPLAAVVLNSLLPSCSTLRYSLSLKPVTKAMKHSPRMSLTPDFFTPQPRRVKGKEKVQNNLTLPCHLSQCQEWSICAKRHSLWCPREYLLQMFVPYLTYFYPRPESRYTDGGICFGPRPTSSLHIKPHIPPPKHSKFFRDPADYVSWPATTCLRCS